MMINRRTASMIGAAALLVATPFSSQARSGVPLPADVPAKVRLHAVALVAEATALGRSELARFDKGMIAIAPFGDGGLTLSARDRPDRGGVKPWSSLRAASATGMTFLETVATLSGRRLVRKYAPAVMLGYDRQPERGAGLALEAGILLRERIASPLSGLSRTIAVGERDPGRGAALLQARFGYRF